jgi:AAA ATPase domain
VTGTAVNAVGRDAEVASLDALFASVPAALELLGQPGIGKTTLVRYAIEHARRSGFFVLFCCPSAVESELAYAALGDLLRDIPQEIVESLPVPQRRAFEAVLAVDPAADVGAGQVQALGVGFLNALAAIGRLQPVFLVVDDVHGSTDPPRLRSSSRCAGCAMRRLHCFCAGGKIPSGFDACLPQSSMSASTLARSASAPPTALFTTGWAPACRGRSSVICTTLRAATRSSLSSSRARTRPLRAPRSWMNSRCRSLRLIRKGHFSELWM